MLRLLTALPVIVAASEPAASGPTLDEYKADEKKNNDALSAEEAKEKKLAAVNKAIDLLESLQKQVLKEGEEEAATYNKFACFCKDTTKEKLDNIQSGEDEQSTLIGEMNKLTSHRETLDGKIEGFLTDIETLEKEMKEATEDREKTKKIYDADSADLSAALEALKGAIKSLKNAKNGPSLVQLKSVSQSVEKVALLADALGLGGEATSRVLSFVQAAPDVPTEDYKFKSDSIISTLEGLLNDFRTKKTDVDKEEVTSVNTYDKLMQDKTQAKTAKEKELDQAREAKAKAMEDVAAANQQLSTVEATLIDDKEYASTLSKMCSDKAKTWDQRSKARADELATLTQAIGIVKGAVKEKTSGSTIRFAQQAVSVGFAEKIASNGAAMNEIEAEAEAADSAPAFVQESLQRRGMLRASVRKHADPSDGGRDLVIDLLKNEGVHLKSTLLTSLASKLEKDHFAKVKKLIQDLIEKLLAQAAEEANKKGFCDKAMSDAQQKRDFAAEEIKTLNVEMAKLESTRDKLAEELDTLTDEIKELKDARTTAEKERTDESAENAATVDEANQGLTALNTVIDLLDKFYKEKKNEKVDLSLAQGPKDDAPDSGFDSGEAYAGAQSEAGGILGMLDVMKSDFERTVSETEAAEEKAKQDHIEFMTQSGKSLAEKEEAEKAKGKWKSDAETKLSESDETLKQETELMRGAITELIELQPQCVDTAMTWDERVARREDEIASLKKAVCILDNYAEYGDGASGSC